MSSDSSTPLREAIALIQRCIDASGTATKPPAHVADTLRAFLALDDDWAADHTFETVLSAAQHVVDGAGAGLALYDPGTRQLVIRAAIGAGSDGVVGQPIPIEGSVSGLAFATGEIQTSRPVFHGIEQQAGYTFTSVLVAPLLRDGDPIGTLTAVNKAGGESFAERDIAAFRHFADLATLLVDRKQREQALVASLAAPETETPAGLEALGDPNRNADFALLREFARLLREEPRARPLATALISTFGR